MNFRFHIMKNCCTMCVRDMRGPIGMLCREKLPSITASEFRFLCGIHARRYAWWPIAHTRLTIAFGAMRKH